MSKTKHKDLQPWLDYFRLLQTHADAGLLLVKSADHEAYITQPCLHALTPGDDPTVQVATGAILGTARHIRDYAAWLAAAAKGLTTFDPKTSAGPGMELPAIPTAELAAYLREPFAVNVVQPDEPHDPLYTILLTQCRRFWRTHEQVEVITYTEEGKED